MRKRRSSLQSEQETKSRLQLQECLSDFGWHLTSPTPDLGEDFIVEIYHEGENTGINFYIQIKSVTNLEDRKSKTTEELVYSLKVKDLKHWTEFSLPVVVCIWDVKTRNGRWAFVRNLILHLNQTNPKWKNRKEVQVYIPWINGTDDNSLKRLKAEIARYVYPLISSGKDLSVNMKLSFPDTLEGKKLREDFDLHIKEGESIVLTRDVIDEIKFSEWWEIWFGQVNPKNAEIYIGEVSSKSIIPLSLRIIPSNGKPVSLSNLEFRFVRVGTELLRLNNEHTSHPTLINLTFRKTRDSEQVNISYALRYSGGEPHEMLQYLDFVKAMAVGGKLQLIFPSPEKSFIWDMEGLPHFLNAVSEYHELVRKLCVIQDKVNQFFDIPEEGISSESADLISKLFEILEKGEVSYLNATTKLELKGKGLQMVLDLHKQGQPIHFQLTASDNCIEIFGTEIWLGPMTKDVRGRIEIGPAELEAAIAELNPEIFLSITLINVHGSERFTDWYSSKK